MQHVSIIAAQLAAGLLVMGTVMPAAVAVESDRASFSLVTKTIRMDYMVAKDGSLLCAMKKADGGEDLPVGGQVFPARTVINPSGATHDQRYSGPVSVMAPNGENLLQLVYESHTVVQESANVEHATVVLRDAVDPLYVELHVRAYKAESIFEQWTTLNNRMAKTVFVQRLDSAFFQSKAGSNAWLEWFDSREGSEAARPEREKLGKGCRILESRHGNRHTSGPEPYFTLGFGAAPEEDKGLCLVSALTWSGSTRLAFEVDDFNALEVSCGVNQPRPVPVDPATTMVSPTCVYTFSAAGKGPASRNFHRWMRRYGMRDGDRLRLVDNNSWEGCGMDVSEQAVIEMMKRSAELGIELYVMDDGWFGNGATARTSDRTGLGDWQLNRQRFPNGLEPLIKAGKENHIEFGIWFEPEMINPTSELFVKHPEWVMRVPGRDLVLRRNQAVLDLANPEVQDFVYHVVADILSAYPGIRFVKWDANSSINNPYSPFLGPDRQGEMLNRYMAGYHGVMAKLVAAYPQVDFQACAAGGGRADTGALKFHHTFWPSDNTHPAYRLGAIWNFTTCMPAMSPTCHVTHAGNEFLPKYRFDVAMMGQLGMEVDPRKSSPEYLAAAKVGIAAYKSVREIVQFGDQYRQQSPFESSTPSLNYVAADQARALVLAYQTADLKQPAAVSSPVSGLAPECHYRAVEINLPAGDDTPRLAPHATLVQSGQEWMKQGLPLIFTRRYDSAAITLEIVQAKD
jgi:alpha-galactosidase